MLTTGRDRASRLIGFGRQKHSVPCQDDRLLNQGHRSPPWVFDNKGVGPAHLTSTRQVLSGETLDLPPEWGLLERERGAADEGRYYKSQFQYLDSRPSLLAQLRHPSSCGWSLSYGIVAETRSNGQNLTPRQIAIV